jgi:hypothetical protein
MAFRFVISRPAKPLLLEGQPLHAHRRVSLPDGVWLRQVVALALVAALVLVLALVLVAVAVAALVAAVLIYLAVVLMSFLALFLQILVVAVLRDMLHLRWLVCRRVRRLVHMSVFPILPQRCPRKVLAVRAVRVRAQGQGQVQVRGLVQARVRVRGRE